MSDESVYTVGVELEYADVDRQHELPPDLGTWATQDYSIVNSDGHANCPTGTRHRWGGEINTVPTSTPEEQGEIVRRLNELLDPKPVINFKCNTHVHVRPADHEALLQDVDALKRLATRMRAAETVVYSVVEPIPVPRAEEFEEGRDGHTRVDQFAGAMRRFRRRQVSHHHSLSDKRWAELQRATTPQEFLDAHAPITAATGRRAWHLAPRPGMNMRSLWKHGTIEFRHFPGSCDPDEIEDCARWARDFLRLMIESDGQPGVLTMELWRSRIWRIPKFVRYDHRLQRGFDATKYG